MGMPTHSEASTPPSQPAQAPQTPTQPPPPPTASSLPPAAIDLATKLFELARAGTTPLLSSYLSAGIPPNLTNGTGDTLLMLAAYHGHTETVRMLLAAGADPNVTNARGQSPIAGAVFKGHDEVVRVLYGAGADKDGGRPTAVEAARIFRREEMLALFGWTGEGEGTDGVPTGVPRGPTSRRTGADGDGHS